MFDFAGSVTEAAFVAKQVVERLVDDLDGSAATQTVSFGVDSVLYRIDLNDKHAGELRDSLGLFIGVARRERRLDGRHAGGRVVVGNKDRNAAVRGWALAEGVELPGRGRMAGAVVAAWEARDVEALYAAVGLERVEEPVADAVSKRSRRRVARAEFSAEA